MRDYFEAQPGMRAKVKLALIERAITDQKSGYQVKVHPAVKEFCGKMNAYQTEAYPGLPHGTAAWWPHRTVPVRDAALIYKPNVGFCDLTFYKLKSGQLARRTYGHLSDRMFIAKTGKSASVRIRVAVLDLESVFETKVPEVEEALEALQELYDLAVKLTVVEEQ